MKEEIYSHKSYQVIVLWLLNYFNYLATESYRKPWKMVN